MNLDTTSPFFRERLFEHQFLFELMWYAWKHDKALLEVSQPRDR